MRLGYVIKFVADMDRAVAFYSDTVGLRLKFASPDWSEFLTGETTLALHIASDKNPAGTVHLGLQCEDLDAFYRDAQAKGVSFPRPPRDEHGTKFAEFLDCDGAPVSVSG